MKINKYLYVIFGMSMFMLFGCGAQNNEIAKINKDANIDCQTQECQQAISETITPAEFKQKLDSGEYDLIDIRTRDEYMNERIADVPNIDIYKDDFNDKLNYLDKTKKYLIYCRSGSRSKMGLQRMRALGFSEVYDLDGGIVDWKKNGFKTIK